jgi:hypothetical protein
LSTDCARAREFVSVQLDGELPEIELDRLETHLRFCPACSAWADEVREITLRLRGASLQQPAERFVLGRRRSTRTAGPVALVAAAAASLMAVLGSSHSLSLGSSRPTRSSHVAPKVGAPAVPGLENARLGLDSLTPVPSTPPSGRFRAI